MAEVPPHIHQDYLGEAVANDVLRQLYEKSFSMREHNLCVRQINNGFFWRGRVWKGVHAGDVCHSVEYPWHICR